MKIHTTPVQGTDNFWAGFQECRDNRQSVLKASFMQSWGQQLWIDERPESDDEYYGMTFGQIERAGGLI